MGGGYPLTWRSDRDYNARALLVKYKEGGCCDTFITKRHMGLCRSLKISTREQLAWFAESGTADPIWPRLASALECSLAFLRWWARVTRRSVYIDDGHRQEFIGARNRTIMQQMFLALPMSGIIDWLFWEGRENLPPSEDRTGSILVQILDRFFSQSRYFRRED